MSVTCSPLILTLAISAFHFSDVMEVPSFSANLSTARNPLLCLVFSYSLPGFPKPAINFITFYPFLLNPHLLISLEP